MQKEIVDTVGGTVTIFTDYCNLLVQNGYDVYGVYCASKTNYPNSIDTKVKMINLKDIEKEIILNYLGESSIITRVLKSGKRRGLRVRESCDYKETVRDKCNIAGFEDEEGIQELRKAVQEKEGNEFSPRISRKKCSFANTLIFAQFDLV